MTEALASKTCTPCRGGIPPLTREQAELFHGQATDWQLLEEAHRIERSFQFRNFREALSFVQEIGELAEVERHHPNICFGWGNATVSLQTKNVRLRMIWDNLSCLGTEALARLGLSLGGFQLMFQSSLSDGVAFDPFSFQKDGSASAEVDVSRCQVL